MKKMKKITPCCPGCQEPYLPGTQACSCGRLLESIGPEQISLEGFPRLAPHDPAPPSTISGFSLNVEGGVHAKFRGKSTNRIYVGAEELEIGRTDPINAIYPDIDLQGVPDFGFTSRKHARIFQEAGRLFVTDIKGEKTTALNSPENILPFNQPVELVAGDRLIVGESVTFLVSKTTAVEIQ